MSGHVSDRSCLGHHVSVSGLVAVIVRSFQCQIVSVSGLVRVKSEIVTSSQFQVWPVSRVSSVNFGQCQNWSVSSLVSVNSTPCQVLSGHISINPCQVASVISLVSVKFAQCQVWTVSSQVSVKSALCQVLSFPNLLSVTSV